MTLKTWLANFRSNRAGLAWIWIVGFVLTLPFCALIYWTMDYPLDLIIISLTGMYSFTGTMLYAWNAVQLIISYLLAFVVIYAVIWVLVNSKSPGVIYG